MQTVINVIGQCLSPGSLSDSSVMPTSVHQKGEPVTSNAESAIEQCQQLNRDKVCHLVCLPDSLVHQKLQCTSINSIHVHCTLSKARGDIWEEKRNKYGHDHRANCHSVPYLVP